MDRLYRKANPWGRENYTGDIDSAILLVSDRRYKNCLDVGTGLGHYAERASKFCDHVHAIDISPRAVKRARNRLTSLPNISFETSNIRKFTPGTKFDLIILGDMLYYLGDVRFPKEFDALIGHIASLVATGGSILMSNFISTNRPGSVFADYIKAFLSHGMVAKRQQTLRNGNKHWIQVVLKN